MQLTQSPEVYLKEAEIHELAAKAARLSGNKHGAIRRLAAAKKARKRARHIVIQQRRRAGAKAA